MRSRRRGKGHRDTHAARRPCPLWRAPPRPIGSWWPTSHARSPRRCAPARPRPPSACASASCSPTPPRRRGRAPARPLRSLEPGLPPLRHPRAVRAALRRLRGHAADVRRWLAGGGLRVEHVTGAGDYVLASGHRRAGPGAAEDDDRPLPGGRQDLRRQRHGARRARGAAHLRRARPRRLAPAPDVADLQRQAGRRPTSASCRPRSCARSTSSRPASPARAPRWPSSATAPPTPSSPTCTPSTPRTASPRSRSTSVHTPAGGDFSDTRGNIEWNIDMQAIHGMAPGISRRSSTSPPRSPTPSSSRPSAPGSTTPTARRS